MSRGCALSAGLRGGPYEDFVDREPAGRVLQSVISAMSSAVMASC